MTTKNVYNTVWRILHIDPNQRTSSLGSPILSNEPVLIEHCATSHYLASDSIQYRNDFGTEYEVCVHSYATNNKSQNLQLEQVGKLTRDQATKFQYN
jgi:phosphotransacetylase